MRFVSPLLKRVVYPSLALTGVFRRTRRQGLAVLTYHGILPQEYAPVDPAFDGNLIEADTFLQQLIRLKRFLPGANSGASFLREQFYSPATMACSTT
jgi:hypothetical protein